MVQTGARSKLYLREVCGQPVRADAATHLPAVALHSATLLIINGHFYRLRPLTSKVFATCGKSSDNVALRQLREEPESGARRLRIPRAPLDAGPPASRPGAHVAPGRFSLSGDQFSTRP